MENIIWAVALWLLVFIIIPMERIRQIWPAAVLAAVWMFILNYIFISLGYYQFTRYIVTIGGVPLFHLIGSAAGGGAIDQLGGEKFLIKVLIVVVFAGLLNLASTLFMMLGAFKMLDGFNHVLHFSINVAGVSLLVWLSLALLGEEKVYEGNKTRYI
ncbi:MAG: hypothetical protein M1119_09605 [Firmicutes bacterium]|nr:hypothetical protein [Bacillota bacterium]